MTHHTTQTHASERGFTLVELAIVMIIIGLLIGGILKGQELIGNAKVSSTVAQTKAIETGISTFRDKFAAIPGDLTNPVVRIANCVGLCNRNGDGNSLIATSAANPPAYDPGAAVVASEAGSAFAQMAAAGMIGGVGGGANAAVATSGVSNPALPLSGSWKIGYNDDNSMTGTTFAVQGGTYVVSTLALATASDQAATYNMTPSQAAIIDRKVDDGLPGSGGVIAIGGAPGANTCASAAVAAAAPNPAVDSQYNEALGTVLCAVAVKVQ